MVICCDGLADNGQAAGTDRERVDPTTLHGKVMVGYQGWFNCPGDEMGLGWTHWSNRRTREAFGPGDATVDLWPDVSELDPEERHATGFRHADGQIAEVFSSANRKTVMRHFRWMRDYRIDGAFLQRFANGLRRDDQRRHKNTVLSHVREGAKRYGRAYAVMYDLSGMKSGSLHRVLEDWSALQSDMELTRDGEYLHHADKPLVAVWGIGFQERHQAGKYSLADCRELIQGLKEAGCSVMLGVPTGWRDLSRDSVSDSLLHEIVRSADVISPWTPGRYRNPKEVERHAAKFWKPDIQWCAAEQPDYLPVVFPGFSWHNLNGDPLDAIPRLKGQFLWSQIVAAKRSGATMIYVAMFDEVDEGTAIFKCTNDPPVGEGVRFLTYEGLPSDHYLKLVGHAGEVLRGHVPVRDEVPMLTESHVEAEPLK